jgi:hypothetical protein
MCQEDFQGFDRHLDNTSSVHAQLWSPRCAGVRPGAGKKGVGLSGTCSNRAFGASDLMRLSRLQRATVWVGLLAFLLMVFGGAGRAVLCFGADGHVSVEFAPTDCCAQTSAAKSQAASNLVTNPAALSAADHCGLCVDIPIPLSIADRQFVSAAKGLPLRHVATPNASMSPVLTFPDGSVSGPLSLPQSGVSTALASLHTVILLI